MSDDKWLDLLGGRSAHAEQDDEKVALALRKTILEDYEQGDKDEDFVPDEAAMQRMLFKCRSEGLLNERKHRVPYRLAAPFAIAATLVLVVGIAIVYRPPLGTQQTDVEIRGIKSQGVFTERAADPFKEMKRIRKLLDGYGVESQVYQSGTAWSVKAEIPADASPKLLEALKPLGFKHGEKTFHIRIEQDD